MGKLIRRGAWSSRSYEATYRLLFEALFWMFLAQAYLTYLLGEEKRFGVAPVTLAFVALAASWLLLPWEPGSSHETGRIVR